MATTERISEQVQSLSQPGERSDGTTRTSARPFWAVLAFWVGAGVDAIMAVAMVHPGLWGWLLKIDGFDPSLRYRIDMGVGAALMLGWTMLLVWGAYRPVERRGVLLMTAFPVITGILTTAICAVATGLATAASLASILILLPTLMVLVVVGYAQARRLALTDERNTAPARRR